MFLLCAAADARLAAEEPAPAEEAAKAAAVWGDEEDWSEDRYRADRCVFNIWSFNLKTRDTVHGLLSWSWSSFHTVPIVPCEWEWEWEWVDKTDARLFFDLSRLVLTLRLRVRVPERGGWEGGWFHPTSQRQCRSDPGRRLADSRQNYWPGTNDKNIENNACIG